MTYSVRELNLIEMAARAGLRELGVSLVKKCAEGPDCPGDLEHALSALMRLHVATSILSYRLFVEFDDPAAAMNETSARMQSLYDEMLPVPFGPEGVTWDSSPR